MILYIPHDNTADRGMSQVENAGLVYACAVDNGDFLDGIKRPAPIST